MSLIEEVIMPVLVVGSIIAAYRFGHYCGEQEEIQNRIGKEIDAEDLQRENGRLAAEVLIWWEEHQYDTCCGGDRNVYREPPEFVKVAIAHQKVIDQSIKP